MDQSIIGNVKEMTKEFTIQSYFTNERREKWTLVSIYLALFLDNLLLTAVGNPNIKNLLIHLNYYVTKQTILHYSSDTSTFCPQPIRRHSQFN